MAKNIPAWKARQGRRGYQVLLVLVIALVLAAAAWGAAEIYGQIIEQKAVQSGTLSS
ncbi:hypothetical protein [Aminobacter sp. MET-1]|uniref:hypothetical protein n=1 Tax=Aminobacter sp. MET-1 TaxID=2951085 RepID=UPI00226A455D|nr:hypothetical protein [Aminobacter sp. MET-1]MCX8570773.1 hypothetical protein [Aminobacter sp. MET-1]